MLQAADDDDVTKASRSPGRHEDAQHSLLNGMAGCGPGQGLRRWNIKLLPQLLVGVTRFPAGLFSGKVSGMASALSKVLIVALAGLAIAVANTAAAQSKKGRVERSFGFAPSVPNIMLDVDEHGTPIIMRDSHTRPTTSESEDRKRKRAERPRRIPRGSSAYVAPTPLPNTSRSSGIVAPPPVTTYNPPPINNPSERINQLNQSFQFNQGLGNNPTNRDAYIRYNLNR
jgi:hypothetical protein